MTDTLKENKAVVYRFNKEFIEGGNADVAMEIVADDFVNHTAPAGVPADREGVISFIKVLRNAIPDINVEIEEQVAEGDLVVTRKRFMGTHQHAFAGIKPSGKKITIPVIDIVRLREGKYVEHWGIRDMQQVLKASMEANV